MSFGDPVSMCIMGTYMTSEDWIIPALGRRTDIIQTSTRSACRAEHAHKRFVPQKYAGEIFGNLDLGFRVLLQDSPFRASKIAVRYERKVVQAWMRYVRVGLDELYNISQNPGLTSNRLGVIKEERVKMLKIGLALAGKPMRFLCQSFSML